MALQVTCVEKAKADSPYQKIKALGGCRRDGTSWRRSLERVINEIEAGDQTYYVNTGGDSPNLVVAMHEGVKYLKTAADKGGPSTLLGLPDCQLVR
jgi:hypothetical protein